MSVADNLARAISARVMTQEDNSRLLKQIGLLTGLHRISTAGWRAAANERDALAAAVGRLSNELDDVRLQCQKEVRCREETQIKLSQAVVNLGLAEKHILELRRQMAEPLLVPGNDVFQDGPLKGQPCREFVLGHNEEVRPEDLERDEGNGDPAF